MSRSLALAEQAERSLLGAMMVDRGGSLWMEACSILAPHEAATPAGRIILAHAANMIQGGKPLDPSVLVTDLIRDGQLQRVGGVAYITDLTSEGVSRGSIKHLAGVLKDAANKRQLAKACAEAIKKTQQAESSYPDCLEELNDSVLSVTANCSVNRTVTPRDVTVAVLEDIERERTIEGLVGLTTGLRDLDEATTGVRAGEFWVVGALPSRGKTALMQQITAANARDGKPVGVFSLEMSKEQLLRRLWLNEARFEDGSKLTAWKLRDPKMLTDDDRRVLRNVAGTVSEWPIYIDDSSSLSISELVARAKLMIRRHDCRLICVDYLRLVNAPVKELRERIAYIADTLRQLAKDTGVPVLALSQLKRPANVNEPPTMIDLKESGDIEAHAHVVLLLYRPMQNGRFTGEDDIIVGKCREGEIGPVPVTYSIRNLIFEPRPGGAQ